jgi:anti-sigma B factor antagonist
VNLTCRHLDGATLITVIGEVDAATSAELEAYIDRQRRCLDEHLIVDLSELSFLDSSGLAVLLSAATLAGVHGAAVHLAAPQDRVVRLLKITGMWNALNVYEDVHEAVRAARDSGGSRGAPGDKVKSSLGDHGREP